MVNREELTPPFFYVVFGMDNINLFILVNYSPLDKMETSSDQFQIMSPHKPMQKGWDITNSGHQ